MNRVATYQQVTKTTFISFVFVVTTGISMATQTSNWVQSAIQELRRSDEYKHQVIDEWYETLPVAQWSDSGVSVVVRFGRNAMQTLPGSSAPLRIAAPPHLECAIAYPSGGRKWSAFDNSVEPFPVAGDDAAAARPRGDVMALRRSYYQALSTMLEAQSLQKKPAQVNAQDCAVVTTVQNRLYEAADSNLLGYYKFASAPMRSWSATHCSATR